MNYVFKNGPQGRKRLYGTETMEKLLAADLPESQNAALIPVASIMDLAIQYKCRPYEINVLAKTIAERLASKKEKDEHTKESKADTLVIEASLLLLKKIAADPASDQSLSRQMIVIHQQLGQIPESMEASRLIAKSLASSSYEKPTFASAFIDDVKLHNLFMEISKEADKTPFISPILAIEAVKSLGMLNATSTLETYVLDKKAQPKLRKESVGQIGNIAANAEFPHNQDAFNALTILSQRLKGTETENTLASMAKERMKNALKNHALRSEHEVLHIHMKKGAKARQPGYKKTKNW
jgi:hypothetical protein